LRPFWIMRLPLLTVKPARASLPNPSAMREAAPSRTMVAALVSWRP
jgi:hypothetical protein